LFEDFHPYISVLKPVLTHIEQGNASCFTSELTLAETLVKPVRTENHQWRDAYINGIQSSNVLTVVPVHREILIQAAYIRASTSNKLPDSIHLATANLSGCTTVLTNDLNMKPLQNIEILYLDHFI
jgi:predicted nucleic acid-binding protein